MICFSAANNEAKENYIKTVLQPINLDWVKSQFGDFDTPKDLNCASIWGARLEKLWADIKTNDIALFYANRHFISYGTIVTKLKNPQLANYLWGTDEYKHIVIISPVIKINSPREKFWKAFNYAPRLYIQGLRIPFVKRQQEILSEFNSIQNFLKYALELDKVTLDKF